jgi:hypothetical protein
MKDRPPLPPSAPALVLAYADAEINGVPVQFAYTVSHNTAANDVWMKVGSEDWIKLDWQSTYDR